MSYQTDKLCIICNRYTENGNTLHHIKTKKAYPQYKDKEWNLIPTCFQHHESVFHRMGISSVTQKYSSVHKWMRDNGWTWDPFQKIWFTPKN